MTINQAKNILKTIKLPDGWKVLIEFPSDKWLKLHLKYSMAMTDIHTKLIWLNPITLRHYNREGLIGIMKHELAHIGQSSHSKDHSRQWYRRALKNGLSLQEEYLLGVSINRSKHKKILSKCFKDWAKCMHKEYEYYIPKKLWN